MKECIFCRRVLREAVPEEHPFARSLVGPDDPNESRPFILRGHVCKECNTQELANLDKTLTKAFDFHRLVYGVPDKKGRSPEIRRGNVKSAHVGKNAYIFVNRTGEDICTPFAQKLYAYDPGRNRSVLPEIIINGDKTWLKFHIVIRGDKPVDIVRAIYKIAFEFISFNNGQSYVLRSEFNPVREFIRYGTYDSTFKTALVKRECIDPLFGVSAKLFTERIEPLVFVQIFENEYLCDLGHDQKMINMLTNQARTSGFEHAILPDIFFGSNNNE